MSKKSELIKDLFTLPARKFTEHLRLDENERIIFSGKFGMGKTTFLREYYFREENQMEYAQEKRYNLIHIFPVNYAVSQNEDIFRYIKYDILLELLRKQVDVESIDLSFTDTLPAFVEKNMLEIGAAFLHMIPAIGKTMADMVSPLKKLLEKFKDHHELLAKQGSDGDLLASFLKNIESTEGTIYEYDVVTKIIEQVLDKWKEEDKSNQATNDSKENVLIIDDLDRIDPDHIFRILNVFAAHFDTRDGRANKFGFDKVILVCDISNIRQIFRAKFGLRVDFNGYIDKFYSHHIFEFNPYKELPKIAERFVFSRLKIRSHGDDDEYIIDAYLKQKTFLKGLLEILVVNGEIDLRNILKLEKVRLNDLRRTELNKIPMPEELEKLAFCIMILSFIKGDAQGLIEALAENKVKTDHIWKSDQPIQIVGACIHLMTYSSQNIFDESPTNIYPLQDFGYKVRVEVGKANDQYKYQVLILNNELQQDTLNDKLFIQIIIETIQYLNRHGVI